MLDSPFPFSSSCFNQVQSGYSSLLENDKAMRELLEMEDWGDIDSFCNEHGFFQLNSVEELLLTSQAKSSQKMHNQLPPSDLNIRKFPTDLRIQEMRNIKDIRVGRVLSQARELTQQFLGGYSSQFRSSGGEDVRNLNINKPCGGNQKLSTEKIMRFVGERFIEFSSQKFINNMLVHPYGSAPSNLTSDKKRDVELAKLLLATAEKVSCQQHNRASKLLSQYEQIASNTGTPSQRVVFYFAEALRERIDKETGRSSPMHAKENGKYDLACSKLRYSVAFLAWHQEIPFTQIMHFTAVQDILENIETNSKVHVIDFEMRSGLQWAVLMQALAEDRTFPIEHLKITAVEIADKEKVEQTGKSLQTFARSLNFQFSFKVLFLSDIKDLSTEQFDILPDEAVVIYASMVLRTMISRSVRIETVMRVVRSLHPTIMLVTEVEANHNSPHFINRFIDALFYYATFFDCLEDSMDRRDQYRTAIEIVALRAGIHNIVATEGKERTTRSVKIDVWRSFFTKFRMVEIPLS